MKVEGDLLRGSAPRPAGNQQRGTSSARQRERARASSDSLRSAIREPGLPLRSLPSGPLIRTFALDRRLSYPSRESCSTQTPTLSYARLVSS